MKRIKPTYFIELCRNRFGGDNEYDPEPLPLNEYTPFCKHESTKHRSIAIFLIKPQTTSLEERMEARIAENVIKGINIINQLK